MKHTTKATAALAVIAALIGAAAVAGPLDPPSGVIKSTSKPLGEIEPRTAINSTNTPGDADSIYRITQAGGYYLTANMLTTSGKNGIEIAASGVTIDLNGFQIASFGGLAAIVPSSTAIERLVIRNGTIVNCTVGVKLESIPSVTVEHVSVEGCSGDGIHTGNNARITACTAFGNNNYGIAVGDYAVITDCSASDNDFAGILVSDYGVVTRCASNANGDRGFTATSGCVISDCAANSNSGNGFYVTSTSSVTKCVATFNDGHGIYVAWNSTVSDCVTFANDTDGIRVDLSCLVKGNTCVSNGTAASPGAGIRATSDENRIEGNNCIRNYRGIHVSQSGNIIVANTCANSDSVNWEIAANNKCLVISAANAPAISGDAGGASPGSTNPWANFTY